MATPTHSKTQRPPVVAILGHIDHGKSTLLDYIRKSNVVAGEAGGITQHISTYEIVHDDPERGAQRITFVDTPGHEAFCDVRSRGATVADIAILIVSAEDGVMPQTKEALQCILDDGVPYIVAINKIDSPKANVDQAKASLIENGVYLEGYGGDIPVVPISAKTGQGVDELLSMILLVAELEELTTTPDAPATGIVVEANKDQKRGISATIIIKNGTLRTGMFVAAHNAYSPVRSIEDTNGNKLMEAIATTPIVISGWSALPPVGSAVESFTSKKDAEAYNALAKETTTQQAAAPRKVASAEHAVIPLIIKTDVSGTGEAIAFELKKIENDRVSFIILTNTTGAISEADMKLAAATTGALVVGMGVSIDAQAAAIQEREGITVATYSIIYELIDFLKQVAKERTPRLMVEEVVATAKVLAIFNQAKKLQVLGAKVTSGTLKVGSKLRILRRDEHIGTGVVKELQQQKIKTTSVAEGSEFGSAIEASVELATGDKLEAIEQVER
ncbi:MAG: translation initiation factor translation initiation factor [Candidatus Parcubacteria bacterium]|jgi:translation initiation factor IF-2